MIFPSYLHDIPMIFPSYPRDIPMIFPSYPHDIPRIFPLIIPSLTPNFTLPHPCGGCKRRSEKGSPGRWTLVNVSHWGDEFRMWLCR